MQFTIKMLKWFTHPSLSFHSLISASTVHSQLNDSDVCTIHYLINSIHYFLLTTTSTICIMEVADVENKMRTTDEQIENSPTKTSNCDLNEELSPVEQKKIIHRIDRRLVLTLGAMYCVSLMDRTNLSSASIAG